MRELSIGNIEAVKVDRRGWISGHRAGPDTGPCRDICNFCSILQFYLGVQVVAQSILPEMELEVQSFEVLVGHVVVY